MYRGFFKKKVYNNYDHLFEHLIYRLGRTPSPVWKHKLYICSQHERMFILDVILPLQPFMSYHTYPVSCKHHTSSTLLSLPLPLSSSEDERFT